MIYSGRYEDLFYSANYLYLRYMCQKLRFCSDTKLFLQTSGDNCSRDEFRIHLLNLVRQLFWFGSYFGFVSQLFGLIWQLFWFGLADFWFGLTL